MFERRSGEATKTSIKTAKEITGISNCVKLLLYNRYNQLPENECQFESFNGF